ncbi:MAG: WD40 repeat domain-containing protein [Gemmataceae bacterium]|nr:WD40 repeat domain-containing protein [Gemmataceae bacterium]
MRTAWMLLAFTVAPAGMAGEPGRQLRPLGMLEGARPTVSYSTIAFSPDGKLLASSTGPAVKLWDVDKQKLIATLVAGAENRAVHCVAFSPDGKTLATAGGGVTLWDVATRKVKAFLKGEGENRDVRSVAFSPDGKTLAAGGSGVTLWDVVTRKEKGSLSHKEAVFSVAFSPDGKTLASGGGKFASNGQPADGEVKLWEVATGRERASLKGGLTLKLTSKFLASLRKEGVPAAVVKELAAWQGKEFRTEGAFEKELTRLFAGVRNRDKRLEYLDRVLLEAQPLHEGTELVWSVAFSPDGKTLASGGVYGSLLLWDVQSGKRRAAPQLFNPEEGEEGLNPAWSVAFSPDGNLLAAGTLRGLKFWDATSGKSVEGLKGPRAAVWSVAFSRDSKTVASAEGKLESLNRDLREPAIRLWELIPSKGRRSDGK